MQAPATLQKTRAIGTRVFWLALTLLLAPVTPLADTGEYDIVIVNGRVMDPETGFDAVRNVGLRGGKIAVITNAAISGERVIDATGHVVTAGFIDTHVHSLDLFSIKLLMRDGVTTGMDLEVGAWPVAGWYAEKEQAWPLNYGTTVSQEIVRMTVHDAADDIDFTRPVDAVRISAARAASLKDGIEGWSVTKSTLEQIIAGTHPVKVDTGR